MIKKEGLFQRLENIKDENEEQLQAIEDQSKKQVDAIKNINMFKTAEDFGFLVQ